MKKQFLSLLSLSLMLGGTSQVKAIDPAALFFAAQGIIAAMQHAAGARIGQYTSVLLSKKINPTTTTRSGLFSKMIQQTSDRVRPYIYNHYRYGIGTIKEDISIPNLSAKWRVFFVDPTQVENPDAVDKKKQTIITGSMIEPEADDDVYIDLWTKNNEEQERLFGLARAIVEGRLEEGADPVTGRFNIYNI